MFHEAVAAYADDRLGPDDLKPRLRIDGCLGFRDITGDFAGQMGLLAPFGTGNPRPLFEANGVEVIDGPRRLKEKHLKMALKQNGRIFRAIAWRAADSLAVRAFLGIALDESGARPNHNLTDAAAESR